MGLSYNIMKHFVKENIMADVGRLQVQAFRGNTLTPVKDARVTVIPRERYNRETAQIQTDSSGQTQVIDLVAPPKELSLNPNNTTQQPYSTCDVIVEAEGFERFQVNGCQILPDTVALQICNLVPLGTPGGTNPAPGGNVTPGVGTINTGVGGTGAGTTGTGTNTNGTRDWWGREIIQPTEVIEVPANRLFGNFPPKIPEDPNKPLPPPPSGFVVLPAPVIPEFIVVHAGVPTNTGAPNYTVRFRDYIKNVASSEIYATWDEKAIRANIYCILSFTLNRIYTEWYRGKGYNFQITNSTAFDHAFTYGRNIFDNISRIVDELFTTYIQRTGAKQPLLAQYCDGRQVQCPGWLTQWGSQALGEQGRTPFQILTNFYGGNIQLVQAKQVSGIPQSFPGSNLKIGSTGPNVRTIQTYLNRIAQNYPAIQKIAISGTYDQATADAVKTFQGIFNLPQTGIVDLATWYSISNIYVGVSKIAELRRSAEPTIETARFYPPIPYEGMINVPNIKYPL